MALTMNPLRGEFLKHALNAEVQHKAIVLKSGTSYKLGSVLGVETIMSATTAFTGTGNGAITMDGTTPILAGAQPGAYKAVCIEPGTNVGQFAVYDPGGVFLGLHTVAGAAFATQIKFTIADGSTDFVAGDAFTITLQRYKQAYTGTGNGVLTMDATNPLLANVKPGAYSVKCTAAATNAGTFTVTDPDGVSLGTHTVAGAAFANQIKFAIADGSTDFIVDDEFTITVAGKYLLAAATATDGSAVAAGILLDDVDATSADKKAVALVKGPAIVRADGLVWASSVNTAELKAAKLAQLAALGIENRVGA